MDDRPPPKPSFSKVRWLKRAEDAGPGHSAQGGAPVQSQEPLLLGAAPGPQPQTPPPPKAPEIPQFLVRPPARPARARRRHWLLLVSFVLLVGLPSLLTALYLWQRAADQYASDVAFSVRTEDKSSAIELLGGITELSGSSSSDTDILFAYLSSQELVAKVDEQVDLRAIWSRVPVRQDPLFAFDRGGTIEDLQAHWRRMISVVYDSGTGLIDLEVRALRRRRPGALPKRCWRPAPR